jgi:hypothetical protein
MRLVVGISIQAGTVALHKDTAGDPELGVTHSIEDGMSFLAVDLNDFNVLDRRTHYRHLLSISPTTRRFGGLMHQVLHWTVA